MTIKRAAAAAFTLVAVSALGGQAAAQQAACPLPLERPVAVRPALPPAPPPPPACVNVNRGTHTCKKPQITAYEAQQDAYRQAVRAYNEQSRAYVNQLNKWMTSVGDYQECEIDALNKDVDILNSRN